MFNISSLFIFVKFFLGIIFSILMTWILCLLFSRGQWNCIRNLGNIRTQSKIRSLNRAIIKLRKLLRSIVMTTIKFNEKFIMTWVNSSILNKQKNYLLSGKSLLSKRLQRAYTLSSKVDTQSHFRKVNRRWISVMTQNNWKCHWDQKYRHNETKWMDRNEVKVKRNEIVSTNLIIKISDFGFFLFWFCRQFLSS